MKKIIFIIVSIITVALSSCYKPNGATSGGTWTFKSQTYNANFTSYISGGLTAQTGSTTPSGSLAFYFYDSTSERTFDTILAHGNDSLSKPPYTWPPKLGTYIVTNVIAKTSYGSIETYTGPDSGYVYVQLTDTAIANEYVFTGTNPVTVTVTKAANGFVTVILPPVELYNINNSRGAPLFFPYTIGYPSYTDSSLVSGKITQTQ